MVYLGLREESMDLWRHSLSGTFQRLVRAVVGATILTLHRSKASALNSSRLPLSMIVEVLIRVKVKAAFFTEGPGCWRSSRSFMD